MNLMKSLCCCAIAVACAMPVTVLAVPITVDQLQLSEEQKIALLRQLQAPGLATLVAAPGIAFGSPVGFGQFMGELSMGLAGETLPRSSDKSVDGSLGFTAGLGSAKTVGVEVGLNVISLTEGFGDSGSFSAKLHKLIGRSSSISIGSESFGPWGLAKQRDASLYGVVTHIARLPGNMPLAVNLGVGNNRFRDANQAVEDNRVGVFGGLALIVNARTSLIMDYTGVGLNLGVSVVPLPQLPITATLGVINVTEQEGSSAEFSGAVGYRVAF